MQYDVPSSSTPIDIVHRNAINDVVREFKAKIRRYRIINAGIVDEQVTATKRLVELKVEYA
jgi:hypothetical protein